MGPHRLRNSVKTLLRVNWTLLVLLCTLTSLSLPVCLSLSLSFLVIRLDAVAPTNTVLDPHGSAIARHCSQMQYGCCPDGRTSARGPRGQGCSQEPSCLDSRYSKGLATYTYDVKYILHTSCVMCNVMCLLIRYVLAIIFQHTVFWTLWHDPESFAS